ncbi:GNAT family protein [Curtobacterium flaccumfaciens]|nr:GNAT family protein [Curtobacterium flaccumfaciens]
MGLLLVGSGRSGAGLATRAVAAAADEAFASGLHRLELGHRTNNPASCAVATRCGFAAEGIERESSGTATNGSTWRPTPGSPPTGCRTSCP